MSKSVWIKIDFTKSSVYKERLAEGKLLVMLPALGAAWGCNGEGFKGRPMRLTIGSQVKINKLKYIII